MTDSPAPLVSVITATYNWSSALRYAIQSVLWQTCHDFEMLIIGDGCTDDSEEVVASFCDPRLYWHNLPHNSGSQSTPNNAGLELTRGRYIAYLGHDDVWYPSHLAMLTTALQETGADLAYSLAVMIGPPGSGVRVLTGLSTSGCFERGMGLPPSSVMHTRELVGHIGGWKDYRTLRKPPDYEFVLRAHDHGARFTAVNALTVFKFNSAWRPDSYRHRPSHEQADYVRRIQEDRDFLASELLEIAAAYALNRSRSPVAIPPQEVIDQMPPGWLVDQWRQIRGLTPKSLDRPTPQAVKEARGPRPLERGAGQPLVSIITPCYNSVKFIEQCIKSVQAQNYPRVEHIVQDGASADGTVEILQHYTGRVDWMSEPDRGQADALDRAIKRSHGDILLVLNADDMLVPNAASWAVEMLAQYPTDAVIYGDLYLMDEFGNAIGEYVGPEYDFASVLCVEKVLPAQAAFIRRSALEQVGLWADATLDTCPDYEMFVRLGLRFPMRHERGFVARYRYWNQANDGTKPRTVDRFVQAKAAVMKRVFSDPLTPVLIKRLQKRAMTGLFLWASQEAQRMGNHMAAIRYYIDALSQTGLYGRLLAPIVRGYLTGLLNKTARSLYNPTPSFQLVLMSGGRLFRALQKASSQSQIPRPPRGV